MAWLGKSLLFIVVMLLGLDGLFRLAIAIAQLLPAGATGISPGGWAALAPLESMIHPVLQWIDSITDAFFMGGLTLLAESLLRALLWLFSLFPVSPQPIAAAVAASNEVKWFVLMIPFGIAIPFTARYSYILGAWLLGLYGLMLAAIIL